MILVSKIVADDMAKRAERLAQEPALQAIRRMPGYAAYEEAVRFASERESLVQVDEIQTEREQARPPTPW